MRRTARTAHLCAAWLLLSYVSAQGAGRVKWWNPAWMFRHRIRIATPDPAQRINTALAVIDTLGKCAKDGRDIRVLDANNRPVPHEVLSAEGGVVRVQFQVPDASVRDYWVYYGNPSAQAEKRPWDKKVGQLKLTTWLYPARQSPGSWEAMEKIFEKKIKPGPAQGSGPREWINERENPFGDNDNFLAVYEGEIFCPESGAYGFATNSDDASFLFLNGSLVAAWPHGHEQSRCWDHSGTIQLERGIHRIKYWLVENTGCQVAKAGWKRPSDKYFSIIPKHAYVQELRTKTVSFEERDQHISCYLTATRIQSLRFNTLERDFVTMQFTDCSTSALGEVKYWEWDFGDGADSLEQNPRHEYLAAGAYKVTLKVKDSLGYESACTRTIQVAGQDPERITVRFDIEKGRNIVRSDEPLLLHLRFRSSSEVPLPLVLDTRVHGGKGELLKLEHDRMVLNEGQWHPVRKRIAPRAVRHKISFRLSYSGVLIVPHTVHVIPAPALDTRLQIAHNCLVDERGDLVVLRTVESVAKGARALLRAKLRGTGPLKVVVLDDSLGPMAPGKESYHDLLKERLSNGGKRPVEVRLAGQTQNASGFPLFVRLCDFPADVVAQEPDVILIVCSITDVLNYVPIDMYERYLSVLIDQALSKPNVGLLLVCPPPLVVKPELSRDYAYATLQMGQLKGIPAVDLFSAFSNMGPAWQKLFQDDEYQNDPVFCLYPNAAGQRIIAEKIYDKMTEDSAE